MKGLLYFIFIVTLSLNSHAQQVEATLSSNYWAGGVCCSQGMDFSLTIRISGEPESCFDEVRMMVNDSAWYAIKELDFNRIVSEDSLVTFSVAFGYSSHGYEYADETPKSTYYGPESLQKFSSNYEWSNDKQFLKLVLIRNRKETLSDKIILKESYTAYP